MGVPVQETLVLLEGLAKRDIRFSVNEGELVCYAEQGVITVQDKANIANHKDRIIDLLKSQENTQNTGVQAGISKGLYEYPLSVGEKGLYFLQTLNPSVSAYNIPLCFRISRTVDLEILDQAWGLMLDKHPVLMTRVSEKSDEFFHTIDRECRSSVEVIKQTFDSPEDELEKLNSRAKKAFNLSTGPLTRFDVYDSSNPKLTVLITVHHLVFDGLSAVILLQDLLETYRSLSQGQHLEFANTSDIFEQFVSWEKSVLESKQGEAHKSYWAEQLLDVPPSFTLAGDINGADEQGFESKVTVKNITGKAAEWVTLFCQQNSYQTSTLFLALFKLTLAKLTDTRDVVVGMPVMVRREESFLSAVGYFINMIPLRSQFTPDMSLSDAIRQVQMTMLDGLYHSSYPYLSILDTVDKHSSQADRSIFDISFAYQNFVSESDEESLPMKQELDIEEVKGVYQEGDFNLSCEVYENTHSFDVHFSYNTRRYSEAFIDLLFERFCSLLNKVEVDSSRRFLDYDLLLPEEESRITQTFNATGLPYEKELCVHEVFTRQAKAYPDNLAIEHTGESITYRDLEKRSRILALHLQALGVVPDTRVVVCMERSVNALVSIMAVVRAGGAYVPLDPDYPDQRLRYILHDCQAPIVLTQESLMTKLNGLLVESSENPSYAENQHLENSATRLIPLDSDWPSIQAWSLDNPELVLRDDVRSDHLVYVIYTSGSTGNPKGVMIEHRNLQSFCAWHTQAYDVTVDSRATLTANVAFDAAVWELWPYLLNGASLVLLDNDTTLDIKQLHDTLIEQRITHCFLVTPIAQNLLQQYALEGSSLKCLLIGGDKFSNYVERDYRFRLVNNYGPTESTVVATSHDIKGSFNAQIIGQPVSNTQVYVLDAELRPQPIGVPGELHIAGDSLARGYLNRSDLTAEKFIHNPFNPGTRLYKSGDMARWTAEGSLEFLGRIDTQVKIRGYRIEVGEIETALREHPSINDAVVVVQGNGADQRLIGFYTLTEQLAESEVESNQAGVDEHALQDYLMSRLPDYMVPAACVMVPKIPLTNNGKVDRRALENTEVAITSNQEYVAPRDACEQALSEMWGELLKLDAQSIGVYDNFFDLGGHSLLATQLASKVRQRFDVDISVKSLFDTHSLEALASYIWLVKEQNLQHVDDDSELEEMSL